MARKLITAFYILIAAACGAMLYGILTAFYILIAAACGAMWYGILTALHASQGLTWFVAVFVFVAALFTMLLVCGPKVGEE